jgi:hypothetical protein
MFIPQMTYEHGEAWWYDTGRGKQKELTENPVLVPLCPP